MALKPHVMHRCVECEVEDPKIIALFTYERYCGRFCLSEGQLKYARLILRARAEDIEHG